METPSPIRLLILDDHQVVRAGIAMLLQHDPTMTVVGAAATAEEALELHRTLGPDVTLVDLRLPGMGGVAFIEAARRQRPDARFVVLTTFDSDEDIYQAFKAGASAYVLKDAFHTEILAAIRAAHAGQRVLPPDVAQRLAQRESAAALTAREVEVLALVARGESNKTAAARLGVSEATVKTHLLHVFAKLGVSDRTSAVTVALERGIIRL